MSNKINEISLRSAARIAGVGYLIIIVLAIFAEFFVRSRLVVPGDAVATVNNIEASEWLFRSGICSYLIAAICDVVVALALFVLLKPVNKSLALLAAWLRVVHATMFGIALGNLFSVLQLLSGANHLKAFNTEQLHGQVMLFLDAFNYEWLIGLVFFGLHCLVLGYLIFKSGYVPKTLGVLLMVAALGYLVDSFANFLLPNYAEYEATFLLIVGVPAIVAELSLCLWLLLKGGKIQMAQ
jgi:hypothetical protein